MSFSSGDKRHMLVAVNTAFLGFSLGSVLVRIFTRLRLVKWLGIDDILIVFAELGVIIMLVGVIVSTYFGLGKHVEKQKPEWRKSYQQCMLATSIAYGFTTTFIRLSLLFFYLRIIQSGTFRLITYIMIAISVAFGLGNIFVVAFQCVPLRMLWDPTSNGHCVDIVTFYFANAGIHILTEFIIYVLPIPALWKLQLPIRQKLGLFGLMGIGALLLVISCYRIATLKDLLNSTNITWDNINPLLWYSVEVNLAIFVACGPALLAFFRHYFPSVFDSSYSQTKAPHTSHKNSYALRSIRNISRRHERGTNGIQTTVTTAIKAGTTWYGEENNSEEMIMGVGGGNSDIQKRVDVWVVNKETDVGRMDTRSNNSVSQHAVAHTV